MAELYEAESEILNPKSETDPNALSSFGIQDFGRVRRRAFATPPRPGTAPASKIAETAKNSGPIPFFASLKTLESSRPQLQHSEFRIQNSEWGSHEAAKARRKHEAALVPARRRRISSPKTGPHRLFVPAREARKDNTKA